MLSQGVSGWTQGVGALLWCPTGAPAPLGLNCSVTEQSLCFIPAQAGQSGVVSRPNSIRPGTPSPVQQRPAQLCKPEFASQKNIILLLFSSFPFF